MTLPTFDELFALTDRQQSRLPVVAAGGDDATVLAALSEAARRKWVQPVVTGSREKIVAMAATEGVDLAPFRIVDAEQPAEAAVAEIRAGRAAALMKGQIDTPALMKAVLNRETGLRTNRVVGQIVLMEVVRDQRAFLLTDTGITIQPSLDQKRDLLRSLLEVGGKLSTDQQSLRIALMAASEKVNEAMPETTEAATLTEEAQRGDFGPCAVQGPLSFDLAYANDAGQKKKLENAVIGAADAMLFPNLLSANLTVKAIMYTADCRFGGLLCGTSAPVVFMSRADSVATRLHSIAFTLQTLQGKN